ncbi:MAG: hypothetical protein P1U81_11075 [Verrucomicrobiales bacterium]|nr:hypothetical protein [Verrucomicrobiales bacterium]
MISLYPAIKRMPDFPEAGPSSFQNDKERNDETRASLADDSDRFARIAPFLEEVDSKGIRLPFQLTIRQRKLAASHGNRIRSGRGYGSEGFDNGFRMGNGRFDNP